MISDFDLFNLNMNFFTKRNYLPISTEKDRDSSSDSDVEDTRGLLHTGNDGHVSHSSRMLNGAIILTIFNVCILGITTILFAIWYHNTHLILNASFRETSAYSPVLDRFDLSPTLKKINGTFYTPRHGGSIGRQQPNAAADKIWDEWELTRVYPVTRSEIRKMGSDPSTVAKLEDSIWGLGDDAYAAIFDVYHQVHCLNSLRHIAYGNYYNLSMARADTVKQREIHINHCIDILLQHIQCSGNLDLIPLHWVETQQYPFPDMSINKQCVNFDGFTEWRKSNTIDMDKYVKVMKMPEGKKPGIKQLPAADQYYEYWGFDNPNHKPVEEGGHGIPDGIDNNL